LLTDSQASAHAFGLEFVPFVIECYDLLISEDCAHSSEVRELAEWLQSGAAENAITELGGYETKKPASSIGSIDQGDFRPDPVNMIIMGSTS
jgi:molybdate-binding protein